MRAALGDLRADLLADTEPGAVGLATLDNLRAGLRGAHLLTLICHGRTTGAGTVLYVAGADGRTAQITGADLAAEIAALDPAQRPLCTVLIACEGPSQEEAPLASVAPLLARAGVPAVVAMQDLAMGAAYDAWGDSLFGVPALRSLLRHTVMASMSTRRAGLASPATTSTAILGGLGRRPQTS